MSRGSAGLEPPEWLADVAFDERGLVPVIAQEAATGEVLMLAYANSEALALTARTGWAHYYSRSRGELWRKGATSGNLQRVDAIRLDCDGDALLYRVAQQGPACHTGQRSCFFQVLAGGAEGDSPAGHSLAAALTLLERVVGDRLRELPEGSYVARLHHRGVGYQAQKVVEEAGESVVAALQGHRDELVDEAADLLFHLAVMLAGQGVTLSQVGAVLEQRHRERRSG